MSSGKKVNGSDYSKQKSKISKIDMEYEILVREE